MNEQQAWERQRSLTPLGCQTLSKSPDRYVSGIYPKLVTHGDKGYTYDVEGNKYIDLIAGLGAVSVGYSNPVINAEVIAQLAKGVSFSFPTTLEADLAELLCAAMPETEMWKFGKNGVDATLMAIRCARAYTGRSKILVHGYHGCSDHFEALGTRRAGMIDLSDHVEALDLSKAYISKELEQFAAVIVEPYVFDSLKWSRLKFICKEFGILLIVDEIVSGGRFKEFSAYQHLGLEPDLVCVGKGIANGFPLSAVGGKAEIMKTFERDDFFASTTFGGEAVSLAAALATLSVLSDKVRGMFNKGQEIKDTFNICFSDIKAECKGYPTRLTFDFPTKEEKALFMQEMCKRGVLVGYSNFVMADHSYQDISHICLAIRDIRKSWTNFKLEGGMPIEALRLRNR